MANHSSASVREETPHVNRTTRTNTIINALKQRAQSVLNDTSIDAQSRAIIRYALEINDPWLARLVRRAEAGDTVVEAIDVSKTPAISNDDREEKIGPLADMICSGGEVSAAALLVLMATLETSADPKTLAHTVKHFAFTRCGEFNVYGMVDSQIAVLESQLLN